MSEGVFDAKRDGGIGNDNARLKRWITVCNDARTCSRVRRRGRASGSFIEGSGGGGGGREGLRDVLLGDKGWLACRYCVVGDEGWEEESVSGGDAASSPLGTNARIASSRPPLEEMASASDSASPRRSSTS